MYTILTSNRTHVVSGADGERIMDAIRTGRALETVEIELNGPGSGTWKVTFNVAQIIALVQSPEASLSETPSAGGSLRLVRS